MLTSIGFLLVLLAACDRTPAPAAKNAVAGTIETDEVRVASRYGGRVEKLFADEGQTLHTGQLIVELDAAELRARREQAAALLAELEAGPRAEEIAAVKHEWEALAAELELARLDERRQRELFAGKINAEADRDRAVSRARTLEKNLAAAKSRHELLLAGTRPERLAQARAQVAELDAHLREMKITAPTNCVLEVLNVKVGDVLAPNREAATLLLLDHLWVRVFVPEAWLGRLQLGQPARVRREADGAREFAGVIEQIGRAAEFTPRNVQTREDRIKQVFGVKVRLNNDGDKLRAGMSVAVEFPGETK